ncbi:hypothetical protein ES703_112776 [subsurface metagenome]
MGLIEFFELEIIEPDSATPAFTNIDRNISYGHLLQLVFTRWTFHNIVLHKSSEINTDTDRVTQIVVLVKIKLEGVSNADERLGEMSCGWREKQYNSG